jgi:hypothetical protein
MRIRSRGRRPLYLSFLIPFVSLAAVKAEELPQSIDPFLGKPAAVALASVAISPLSRIESTLGKQPFLLIYDGPPPRSTGPGLRFDTHRFFYIYTDANASPNHYAPSGWMGDYGDLKLDMANQEDPADGKTCIKIVYSGEGRQGLGWAGMYWQEPANNWGNKHGGFNLSGMRRLTFWARGAKGGEEIAEFKIGGIQGMGPDTGVAEIGPVTLSADWKYYVMDLSNIDLSKLSGGFAWSASRTDNPTGMTFYLDEIRFER